MAAPEDKYRQDQDDAVARLEQADTQEDRQAVLDEMIERDLLKGAVLYGTNLSGVWLLEAKLIGANLLEADLSNANLSYANLSEAELCDANLSGATLRNTILERAMHVTREQLRQARSLKGTILPDGTKLPGRPREDFRDRNPKPPWNEAFEKWAKTVPVNIHGHIIVA
jgi:uncharacterized protein YjbI with pentapeptide repeats